VANRTDWADALSDAGNQSLAMRGGTVNTNVKASPSNAADM